jgi:hypothetical protein
MRQPGYRIDQYAKPKQSTSILLVYCTNVSMYGTSNVVCILKLDQLKKKKTEKAECLIEGLICTKKRVTNKKRMVFSKNELYEYNLIIINHLSYSD